MTQLGSVEWCRLKGPLICPAVIHQQLLKPLKPLFIIFNAYRRPHSAFLFCSLLPLRLHRLLGFPSSRPLSQKPWKSIFYSSSASGGVHVFGVPQRGERSGRFQGSAWLFLPEGFGVPQTKQQNILRCGHVVCISLQRQDMF